MESISTLIPSAEIKDPLKEIKKYCFYRAKAEYKGAKPFGVYWWQRTGHLKTLSDWAYAKSNADQESARGASWFQVFIGQLKVK